MRGVLVFIILLNFVLGVGIGLLFQEFQLAEETPLAFQPGGTETISPYNHIKEHQISVEENKVIIQLEGRDVRWSRYTNSNSMDQTFDEGHNGIEVVPRSPEEIHVGDIIAFRYNSNLIVHRVVELGTDERGWYAKTKGDNNNHVDPGKRRFEDVERLTVGILF